jgi:acyl-CoA reductase-like NAD-dependent aldehyde dehydrogenase
MNVIEGQLFIDGQFRAAAGVEPVLEAATGQPLGDGASASQADVFEAVAAARSALPEWRSSTPVERAEVLLRFAAALQSRGADTAEIVTRENGMPMSLSRIVNGFAPAALVKYYAKLITKIEDEEVRAGKAGHTIVRREAVGVVGAITPWNFPQGLAIAKVAPALAAGCTMVLKASPEVALDVMVFAEAAIEAGLPRGVLNVVPGGAAAGMCLVEHPGIDKVSFTGSTATGRSIAATCGGLLRPVTLELGGKSAAIILDDADLDATMSGLRDASFMNNGQTCHLSSRILAPRSRYAEIVEALVALSEDLVVGDPLDQRTEIGPLVSARQRTRVLDYIEIGRAEGARLVAGGSVPADQPRGWFVAPTVFADVDNASRLAREEIFGPVLTVTPYDDEREAIEIANDSDYGLAGTVWSADVERATDVARRIVTGTVGINMYQLDMNSPFGGVKASGTGRELGPEGLEAYRTLKSIYRPDPA